MSQTFLPPSSSALCSICILRNYRSLKGVKTKRKNFPFTDSEAAHAAEEVKRFLDDAQNTQNKMTGRKPQMHVEMWKKKGLNN